MPKPFLPETLFEINEDAEIIKTEHYTYVDNYYKNYDEIQNLLEDMPVENWKHRYNDTRNFIDYYDCRPKISNWFPDVDLLNKRKTFINKIVKTAFGTDLIHFLPTFQFNVFKHCVKNVPKHMQPHPHYDDYPNLMVYLDSFENGGTAIYKNIPIEDTEINNALYDISDLEILEIIPAKPNRAVLFSGKKLHGAYIEDHNVYYDNWRINNSSFQIILDEV